LSCGRLGHSRAVTTVAILITTAERDVSGIERLAGLDAGDGVTTDIPFHHLPKTQ